MHKLTSVDIVHLTTTPASNILSRPFASVTCTGIVLGTTSESCTYLMYVMCLSPELLFSDHHQVVDGNLQEWPAVGTDKAARHHDFWPTAGKSFRARHEW